MNKTFASLLFLLMSISHAVAQSAPDAGSRNQIDPDIRAKILSKLPGSKSEDVLVMPGISLYEVRIGGNTAYVTTDGKYLVTGELFDIANKINITEERRREIRKTYLKDIRDSDSIIFEPSGRVKHTITVFTDMDCPYCRKLHSEIAEINSHGIRVRYVAFPRSGPGTESWFKAESVWCSKDRRAALTRAKLGENIATTKCEQAHIENQYHIGEQIGIQGTPMILSEDAQLVGGYLPADKLIERLEELTKQGVENKMQR